MPKGFANSKTDAAAASLNPTGSSAVAGGQVVQVNLHFSGATSPNLSGFFDAMETLYGSGKVSSETDTVSRGNLRLRIDP